MMMNTTMPKNMLNLLDSIDNKHIGVIKND